MLKHTPGPWMIQEDNLGCKIIIGNLKMTDEEYSLFTCNEIGFTDGLSDESEDIANARLISAAPDLLEALKDALMVMTSQKVRIEEQADAITKARAAIAKAEGGE